MQVAVDVGGTFTDLVAVDDTTGGLYAVKVPSVPSAPEKGFVEALRRLAEKDVGLKSIGRLVHAGTIATNLLLGQIGLEVPTCALLTTEGFRDMIEIGRQNRPELYNVFFERPRPLVGRDLRFEAAERTDFDGRVMKRPDKKDLARLAGRLKRLGVETVAVCFLNSFANGSNEAAAKAALEGCGLEVHASHEIDPQYREFERTSTTVVNAIMAPVVSRYLNRVHEILGAAGVSCGMQLLSSSGGLVDEEEATKRPIVAIESGPAAGVMGTAEVAKLHSLPRVISFDMGGTTAKAGAVLGYQPLAVHEIEVGGKVHMGRSVKGSGYPVRYPSVDLAEVSAGGGTVIWADSSGALRVGPLSAGAEPGPVCYGRGGKEPTVTDANLHLGRLRGMLGGELALDTEAASMALERVGKAVGASADETASAALSLVNSQMSRAVNIVSLERGLDPREFVLVAFGGAGPMHAAELAEMVGITRVVVPPRPGLFSAVGMLGTDMKYSAVRGYLADLDEVDADKVRRAYSEMESDLRRRLRVRGIGLDGAEALRSVDARYRKQGYELEVPLAGEFASSSVREGFHDRHVRLYGFGHEGTPVEIVALRLQLRIPSKHADVLSGGKAGPGAEPRKARAWFSGSWRDVTACSRELAEGGQKGPLIVEEYDSTVVVPPGWRCTGAAGGCLALEAGA